MNIHFLNGRYLGFIFESYLFSRDGELMGYAEDGHVWTKHGNFVGTITEIKGNNYILRKLFGIEPLPRQRVMVSVSAMIPAEQYLVEPVVVDNFSRDGFKMSVNYSVNYL